MSSQLPTRLLDAHAFNGSPLHVDLPAFHVPFDDPGRTGTESGVLHAAHSTERLGLQGPIRSGKTSVLRFALDDPTARSRRSGCRSRSTTTPCCSTRAASALT